MADHNKRLNKENLELKSANAIYRQASDYWSKRNEFFIESSADEAPWAKPEHTICNQYEDDQP